MLTPNRCWRTAACCSPRTEPAGATTEGVSSRAVFAACPRAPWSYKQIVAALPPTPETPLPVGAYRLEAPIGRGGTATVWRARHAVGGETVALKVLAPERLGRGLARAAFHTEVRAQARLDHPRIVRVRSHGFVDASVSGPGVPAGAAWLAMDLAPHGSLDRYPEPLSWAGIKGVLLGLLDALAHAHARGVVHRDLKAANLLVFRHAAEPGGPPDVRVADFGLAHAVGGGSAGGARLGTPRAMAPEQFRGLTSDQGPWTDLYALGCLAWELVCGEPVFPGHEAETQRMAHLLQEPRPLPSDLHVPVGFEDWLHRCLAKAPEARFRFAADAAHALLALPEPVRLTFSARVVALEGLTTLPVEGGPAHTLAWALDPLDEPAGPVPTVEPLGPALSVIPPCPQSWRARVVDPVRGAGSALSLFGLRRRPVVGRLVERDLAWGALVAARAGHTARAVLIDGPDGVGKTRLASWLAERWHEVGGGPSIRVSCTGGGSLERGVGRALGTVGLAPASARSRIQSILQRQGVRDPYEGEALARLLGVSEGGGEVGLSTEEERWAVVLRVARRAEPGRVPILVFDDAQADPDVLAFTSWVVARESASTVIVLTLADQAVASEDDSVMSVVSAREAVDRARMGLVEHHRTVNIQLRPLDAGDHIALLRVLGLSGALAAEVAERTAGTPLLAVQLVEEMLRTGQVVETSAGLVQAPAATRRLPPDAGSVWAARAARVRAACSGAELEAVGLAAVLGVEVERSAWGAACAAVGGTLPLHVADLLCAEGLWQARPWGWLSAHALAHEALLRSVPAELLPGLHAVCADALESVSDDARSAGRIGRHRLAAGDPRRAFPALLSAAKAEKSRGSLDSALRLARAARRALDADSAKPDDSRRAVLGILRAELLGLRGRPDAALRRLHPAARIARRGGLAGPLAAALRLEGGLARQRGELLRATELLREARGLAAASGDAAGEAHAVLALARVAHRQGRTEAADGLARTGLSLARRAARPRAVATALRTLAGVARLRGDIDGAVSLAASSRDAAVAVHDRLGEAGALIALGRAAEAGDEPEAARDRFSRAADLYDTIGSPETHVARLHVARTLTEEGRFDEARVLVEAAGESFARLGRRGGLAAADILRLSLHAQAREWSAWRLHLRRARRLLRSTGLLDPDLALGLERAAVVAEGSGSAIAAAAALDLAAHLWGALGDAERAASCRANVAGPGAPAPR